MPRSAPLLDERTFRDLMKELFRQADQAFKDAPAGVGSWKPSPNGWARDGLATPDAGTVLAALFARMMEIALQRLNRVPQKNLLAFLNLMGISLLPPAPARGPIMLTLAPGTSSALVPRGLQVTTADGLTFETERDLPVTSSRLVAGWTIDPVQDRFTEQNVQADGRSTQAWRPFEGNLQLPHVLYFANTELLNFSQATRVQIRFPVGDSGLQGMDLTTLSRAIRWSYWHDGQPRLLRMVDKYPRIESTKADSPTPEAHVVMEFVDAELDKRLQPTSTSSTPPPISGGAADRRRSPRITFDVTAATGTPGIVRRINGAGDGAALQISPTAGKSLFELGAVSYVNLVEAFRTQLPPEARIEQLYKYAFVLPPLKEHEKFRLLAVDQLPLGGVGLPQSITTRWIGAELIEPLPGNQLAMAVRLKQVKMHVTSDLVSPDYSYTNATAVEPGKHFQPFGARPTGGDALYLGSEEVFGKQGAKVSIRLGEAPTLRWEYWNPPNDPEKHNWSDLKLTPEKLTPESDGMKDARNFTQAGTVMFDCPPTMANAQLGAQEVPESSGGKTWLRVTLARGNYLRPPMIVLNAFVSGDQQQVIPSWRWGWGWGWEWVRSIPTTLPVSPQWVSAESLEVYVDKEKVDNPAQPFSPLGAQPGPDVKLYVGFKLPDAHKRVMLSIGTASPSRRLLWEYGTAEGWVPMDVIDGTNGFTEGGEIQLVCPQTGIRPKSVNGRISRWVRCRLVAGDYGRDADYIPVNPDDPTKGFKLRTGTGKIIPPTIYSLSMSYEADSTVQVIRQTGTILEQLLPPDGESRPAFLPTTDIDLVPLRDEHPALYLGFDRPFDNLPVTLYVAGASREFSSGGLHVRVPRLIDSREAQKQLVPGAPPRWQYWNGQFWVNLPVADGTAAFSESGQMTFVAPKDMAKLARFDRTEAYWLRVQWLDRMDDLPSIAGIYLNSVPAVQAVTVHDELVGSSSGRASQVFKLQRSPILPGQQIWLLEPEEPSEEERNAVEQEEGHDAVEVWIDPVTELSQAWVQWHEVSTLAASGPRDRHYTLDHTTGELRFGDGECGLVPPRGVDNIRCRTYRSGGGASGNQPAGAITKLKNAPAFISKATNPLPTDGGADLETVADAMDRGPYTLKHRNRAVSAEDFEWLAKQASGTQVARTKCLPRLDRQLQPTPGWATVIVVPQGNAAHLTPSAELIREVEDYLEARAFGGLVRMPPGRVNVLGPGYLMIAVHAQVVPTDMADAEQVRQRVLTALDAFFHPLRGGEKGVGWSFGRNIYLSEVAALLEGVEGVHHVGNLSLAPNSLIDWIKLKSPVTPSDIASEGYLVLSADGSTSAVLAEPLAAKVPIDTLVVKGFKEGDQITLALDLEVRVRLQDDPPGELAVTLPGRVPPVRSPLTFPRNSIVMREDGRTLTRLDAPVPAWRPVKSLRLASDVSAFSPGERVTLFYPFNTTIRLVRRPRQSLAGMKEGVSLTVDPWPVYSRDSIGSPLRISTLDNTVRAPLAEDIRSGEVTAIKVDTFARKDIFVAYLSRTPATSATPVDSVTARTDLVYVEDNYLVYPGAHEITMVGKTDSGGD